MELQLPVNWKLEKLGNVCETTSGGTPSRKQPEYYGGNIPWIKSGELDKGVITDSEEKITSEALKNSSAKLFPKGTLLIALYGATIGKLAFLGIEAATNQAICGIFKNDEIDQRYLYNYLFFKRRDLINQGIGGAQPNISQTILKNLDLPVPPPKDQHQIVEKIEELFSELDKGIENLKTAQQQLKVYRQAVLKWAFEGKLNNDNVKDGELPVGWEWKRVSSIGKVETGSTPSKQNPAFYSMGYPFYKPTDLEAGYNVRKASDNLSELGIKQARFLPSNSILVTCIGATIGKTGIIREPGASNQQINAIILSENYNPNFIYYQVISSDFQNAIKNNASATTLPIINKSKFQSLEMVVCSKDEQSRIVQKIESRLSVCDKMEETISTSLQQAEALRQSILKRAFEGKLVKNESLVTLNT